MTENTPARAVWARNVRAVLRVVETHPALPLPYIARDRINFFMVPGLFGPAGRKAVADAETALSNALGITFTGAIRPDNHYYYDLTATLPGGLPLVLQMVASEVAEKRVTGEVVTEVVEWVRRPAGDEAEGGENA